MGAVQQREWCSFVYIYFIDACIECVYDLLEFALGMFPFSGGHKFHIVEMVNSCDSRLVASHNLNKECMYGLLGHWIGSFWFVF